MSKYKLCFPYFSGKMDFYPSITAQAGLIKSVLHYMHIVKKKIVGLTCP